MPEPSYPTKCPYCAGSVRYVVHSDESVTRRCEGRCGHQRKMTALDFEAAGIKGEAAHG